MTWRSAEAAYMPVVPRSPGRSAEAAYVPWTRRSAAAAYIPGCLITTRVHHLVASPTARIILIAAALHFNRSCLVPHRSRTFGRMPIAGFVLPLELWESRLSCHDVPYVTKRRSSLHATGEAASCLHALL